MPLQPTALAHFLANEATMLADLRVLLAREQEALVGANADDLEEIAPEKSRLLNDITEAVWARDALLQSHGFAAGDSGVVAACMDHGGLDDACSPLWDEIQSNVAECQEINRVNGVLLQQLTARTSTLVASLLGHRTESGYSR